MILLKWGKMVDGPNHQAYLSNRIIGKVFGIDGSSIRRLYITPKPQNPGEMKFV